MNCLVEIVCVLKELRRVARQLEADRYVSMSRAPPLIHELYETLQIMSGDMLPNARNFYETQIREALMLFSEIDLVALPTVPSSATQDAARDESRKPRLIRTSSRQLCPALRDALRRRLGDLSQQIDPALMMWNSSGCQIGFGGANNVLEPMASAARRTLLFYLVALVDVNECELDFLDWTPFERQSYFSSLYEALVKDVVELDDFVALSDSVLKVLFELFLKQMRETLKREGRKEPNQALVYWKSMNHNAGLVSSVPFNMVARAFLAAQASSAAAERLFSDSGVFRALTASRYLQARLKCAN